MFPRAMGPRLRAVHLIVFVLVVVVLVSLSSAAGAVGVGQPGIGVMRFTATGGGPQSSLPRYGTVFLSPSRTTDLAYIKQSSPSTLVPAYKDATVAGSCGSSTSTPTSCPTVVGYAEALAHDNANPSDRWLVRDASGNPIHDKSYTSDYFVNVGSASYQQRALTYLLATIQNPSPDFDGISFDNTNPAYLYRTGGIQGYVNGTLLSDSLWQTSMVNFLKYVGGGLRGKGYYVAANGGVSGDNDGASPATGGRRSPPTSTGSGSSTSRRGLTKCSSSTALVTGTASITAGSASPTPPRASARTSSAAATASPPTRTR